MAADQFKMADIEKMSNEKIRRAEFLLTGFKN